MSDEKKQEGKISGAVYEAEITSPIVPDGVVLKIKANDGQDLVRGVMKLIKIAKKIESHCVL